MNRLVLSFLLALATSATAAAQTPGADPWDFPTGFSGRPQSKLKGRVRTVLTIEQRDEKVFSTVVEVYDAQGRLTETLSSNAGIEVHSGTMVRLGAKSTYAYDAAGRLLRQNNFSPEGRYTGFETYTYDAQGRLTGSTMYNRDGKETGQQTYTYSAKRREVVATWNFYYDGRVGKPSKNLLFYDEAGRWTKRMNYDPSGREDGYVTFEYDARGNFVKDVHCCKYNYSHSYEYEFDREGNWIERRDTQSQPGANGGTDSTPGWMHTYRIITYYSDHQTPAQK